MPGARLPKVLQGQDGCAVPRRRRLRGPGDRAACPARQETLAGLEPLRAGSSARPARPTSSPWHPRQVDDEPQRQDAPQDLRRRRLRARGQGRFLGPHADQPTSRLRRASRTSSKRVQERTATSCGKSHPTPTGRGHVGALVYAQNCTCPRGARPVAVGPPPHRANRGPACRPTSASQPHKDEVPGWRLVHDASRFTEQRAQTCAASDKAAPLYTPSTLILGDSFTQVVGSSCCHRCSAHLDHASVHRDSHPTPALVQRGLSSDTIVLNHRALGDRDYGSCRRPARCLG